MEWWEKVLRIRAEVGVSWAAVERLAGWERNTLSPTLSRKSMPLADRGIALARALRVPAEWLFDAEAGWPPPGFIPLQEAPRRKRRGGRSLREK